MGKINLLDSSIYNRIAAGEVVERPFSVVKELVENAIDAGATSVTIEIEGGGIDLIRVSDNGCGMSAEDVQKAFLAHATSKIACTDDLDSIATLGFRGEALASIASVAKMTISSREKDGDLGYSMTVENGKVVEEGETGSARGTIVTVENLFQNVPARKKFLKKAASEEADISGLITKFILADNDISFKYSANGKVIFQSSGLGLKDAIYTVYGADTVEKLSYIECEAGDTRIYGYINKPGFTKHNRAFQTLVVNGRFVVNSEISYVVQNAYQQFLMKRQYPVYVFFVELPYENVDVNVHPNKLEVKFADFEKIKSMLYRRISAYLDEVVRYPQGVTRSAAPEEKEEVQQASEEAKKEIDEIFSTKPAPESNIEARIKSKIAVTQTLIDGAKIRSTFLSSEKSASSDSMKSSSNYSAFMNLYPGDISTSTPQKDAATNSSGLKEVRIDGDSAKSIDWSEEKSVDSEKIQSTQIEQVSFGLTKEYEVIGSVFNTYVIVSSGETCFFIDQHAAHEKLLYDKLKKQTDEGNIAVQDFLIPYVFDLSFSDADKLLGGLDELNNLGFSVSALSGNSFSVSAVPLALAGMDMSAFVHDLTDAVNQKKFAKSEFIKETLMQTACKAAVKGGSKLEIEELKLLISEIIEKDVSLYCPHGRPIAVSLTKKELEKWFKRIV